MEESCIAMDSLDPHPTPFPRVRWTNLRAMDLSGGNTLLHLLHIARTMIML